MTAFTVPPGNPEGLRSVVNRVSQLSSTIGETRNDKIRSAGETAAGALPTARVAAFAAARGDAEKATSAVGLSLVSVGGALASYADALESAQKAVRDASSRHQEAETQWRRARNAGDTELAEEHQRDMNREETAAENARADLVTARNQATSALGAELDVWVPGGGALTPVQAWQQATTGMLPAGTTIDPQQLVDLYNNPDVTLAKDTASSLVKAATKGYALYGLVNYVRSPALSQRAEAKLLKTRDLYQALKGAAPDLSDPKAYKAYMKAERAMLKAYTSSNPADVMRAQRHFKLLRGLQGEANALASVARSHPSLTPAQIRGVPGRFDNLMRPVRAVGPVAARIMGPVSVLTGGLDIYSAVTDSTLETDDRVARFVGGSASVVGGVATTLVAFGLVANPVGLAVVAGAGVIAAGAYIYENREAIVDGAKRLGSAIAESPVGDAAKKVWKGLFG